MEATGLLSPLNAFGPTSATGSLLPYGGLGNGGAGNFFLTYEAILPDGMIEVGNGSALADITTGIRDGAQNYNVGFATFQSTIPEPSSIVQAALAILTIAIVACTRHHVFHKRDA
jgi:hypothetical protein